MNIKRLFLSIIGILILNGCARFSTDPMPAFLDVRQTICDRTGEKLEWSDCCSSLSILLDEIFQKELTLSDAVRVALLNNKRLQAEFGRLGIAQAELVQAGLLKNPIFQMDFKYDKTWFASDHITDMVGLQNFLDILLKPLKIKMAKRELEAVKADVAGKVLDLIAETKIAFFSLQAAEHNFENQIKLLDALEAAYLFAKRMHKAGNINNLDLAEKRSFYESMKINAANAEIEILDFRENLNALMGLWKDEINWRLCKDLPPFPDNLSTILPIENQAIRNSLDLKAKRERIQATAALVGINVTETVFPEFGLGIATERESDAIWYVGPFLSGTVPIFDFGQAQKAAGRAELCRLWNEYTALAIEIRSKARSASFHLRNTFRQGKYYREVLLPLAQEVMDNAFLQYNAMQIGVFELLIAKQKEIQTKKQEILITRDHWIAMTKLEKLVQGRM